jgi:hypothetical protein
MATAPHTLRAVIGEGVRRVRERDGTTQEAVALAARRHGLHWARTRVALLERGEKAIPAEELALLPAILADACGRPVGLAELIDPDAVIRLSDMVTVTGRELVELFAGAAPALPCAGPAAADETGRRLRDAGEPEENAARRLGVPLIDVVAAARALWGRGLSAERDARVAAGPEVSPHRRSALRGRVTRSLVDALAAEMAAREPAR